MSEITEQRANLAAALAKANTEISNPVFDKVNPHFRSKYASLAAVRNALVPAYAKYGLSIVQDLQSTEGGIACYTTFIHESGEERTMGPLVMPVTKQDAQGYTSAGTYAKRVHLQAVACVVGDEDDDAEAAVGRGGKAGTVTDPRGEETSRQSFDPAERDRYVSRFIDAFDMDAEEIEIAKAVEAIHKEIAHKHDLYLAVGDGLGVKKNAIRKYIDMLKKQKAAA